MDIRIKLKIFGVPLAVPENAFFDNNGVVNNKSIPEYKISKKHNASNYHCVREESVVGILRAGKEDTATNLADLLTKFLPYYWKQELLGLLLYNY